MSSDVVWISNNETNAKWLFAACGETALEREQDCQREGAAVPMPTLLTSQHKP